MRPIEIALVILLAASLLQYVLPRQRPARWLAPFLAIAVLLILILHFLLEKLRWQMAPAYGLTLVLVGISTTRHLFSPIQNDPKRSLARQWAFFLAFFTLAISVVLSAALPVFRLPHTSGPYAVGVQDFHLVDPSRGEAFTPDPDDRRELMLRVWYPAEGPSAKPASYWPDIERIGPVVLKQMSLPAFALNYLSLVKTNSYQDAQVAAALPQYPVLIFSHGYGFDDFAGHQAITEDLASNGYIVVSINHPYESLVTAYPDGRIIPADPRALGIFTSSNTTIRLDDQFGAWVADGLFVLDQLEQFQNGAIPNAFTGRMDLEEIGIFGYSFGGSMTTEICLKDPRCKAGANIDGGQFGYVDFTKEHVRTPFLFFYHEADERMNDYIYYRVENWTYRVTVKGSTHASYTDKVLWSPLMHLVTDQKFFNFGALAFGPIDAQEMIQIQRAYLLAFFDHYIKGENPAILNSQGSPFPEVDYQFRRYP